MDKKSYKEGLNLPIGSRDYRAYVGPPEDYDINAALQFNLLTTLGLREHHRLLDIGCGSLLGGKLFIPYLLPGKYFGIEPEKWLIKKGLKKNLGQDIVKIKRPQFSYNSNFDLSVFKKKFDFLIAHSIFSHTSAQQIIKCINEAKKVMKKNSLFVASFVKGKKNYKGKKWVYPECVTYRKDFFETMAKELDLVCQEIDWPHPNQQTWILLKFLGNRTEFSDLSSSAKLMKLQGQLSYSQKSLTSMQSHPYVKLGLAIKNLYQSIRRIYANTRLK